MKKFILILLPLLLTISCKKDLTSINTDPKNPKVVPSASLFTGAQKSLADLLTSSNVNTNIFRLIVQYWTETTYTDESNFDLTTRQIPRSVWNGLYRTVLANFQETKRVINLDVADAAQKKNELAITEIMEIYSWYYLVTTFGNVPYSEALNIAITQPKYDDQKTIYYDLLTRLDAAIGNLSTTGDSFGDADVIYKGDPAAWKKFANSFKLKMGMTISDYDNAKAKTVVESAVQAGVFTSNADNATFSYLSGPPNTNPVWVDLVQSGRKDFVATSTIVDNMRALNDPRLAAYFTFDASGTDYSGGTPGASNNYATYSKPSGPNLVKSSTGGITNANFPALLLSYDEVEFFLAEAVERGYNVGGTAVQHYNNAITASITYWGGTTAQATAYLAQPAVAFNPATWKKQIGEQKWLALYNRGWDEWIEWRRLDYPQLVAPSTANSVIPLRFTYPIPEQNLNTANYNAASTAIGGDKVSTKLFWDVN
ncbi:MAG TPA: SusD/RagB family nutrient-binding outer membrane lipoprotein [Flavisolibacter sp.]|nr:SusD/RagB family nutrient-binding outer membrane lipoprotein [Flavisolibacter sp.]